MSSTALPESSVTSLGFSKPPQQTEIRQATSLQSINDLKKEENPYAAFNGAINHNEANGNTRSDVIKKDGEKEALNENEAGERDSIDDGINMEVSPSPSDTEATNDAVYTETNDVMPDADIVLEKFEEFLEVYSPMRDSEEESFRRMSVEQKWQHINKQQTHAPIYDASYYITQLSNHGAASKKRKSWGRSSKDKITQLSFLLRKLKGDLHMAYTSFVSEFVSGGGMRCLMSVLKEIQADQQATGTSKRSKMELYMQFVQDEYDCLLCMKFTRKHQDSIIQLANIDSFDYITLCLYSNNAKTRIVTLQILCLVCDNSMGFKRVIESLNTQSHKNNEIMHFSTLVTMLNKRDSLPFQIWSVRFFNKLWKCTQVANAKVYLQYELEQAGFDPDALDRYGLNSGLEFEHLQKELDTWRQNYINVASSRQELVELDNRNSYLRQEIDRQNMVIRSLEQSVTTGQQEVNKWKNKCDHFRERAAELQDTVEKLSHLYKSKTGEAPDPSVRADEASKPLDVYGTLTPALLEQVKAGSASVQLTRKTSRSKSLQNNALISSLSKRKAQPRPSLQIPPAPPQFRSSTVGRKFLKSTQHHLPLFNMVPLVTVANTLFEDIDDEEKLREIDFTEFEEKFKLPAPKESSEKLDRLQTMIAKSAQKIRVVDTDRAKNMIITQRRIGKSAEEIAQAIDLCDMMVVDGEMAEQLLKYTPTKEEMKKLSEESHQYSSMGEAEQFLFQLMQVERLESKLNVMVFMGIFDDLASSLAPEIEVIYQNSQNILLCDKLKKIFEIILAFGNYMNSNRRGYVLGFKLESLKKLSDVKSTEDKSYTLLHYLEQYVHTKYPAVHQFSHQLDLTYEKGVSYQAIFADVIGLRKGLDLLKFEMDKQPGNEVIAHFHSTASGIISEIADSFHQMEKSYEKVCLMFGENYKTVETEDIFRPLIDFCLQYQKCSKENYKRKHHEISSPRQETASALSSPRSKALPVTTGGRVTTQPIPSREASFSSSHSDKLGKPPALKNTRHNPLTKSMPEPIFSKHKPQTSTSMPKKFTFTRPQLKPVPHKSDMIQEEEEPAIDYDKDDDSIKLETPRSYGEESVRSEGNQSSTSRSFDSYPAGETSYQNLGVHKDMIPKNILEYRKSVSEKPANESQEDSDVKTTSHSKMFPAVQTLPTSAKNRRNNNLSKSDSFGVEKNEFEHKPVIKLTAQFEKKNFDNITNHSFSRPQKTLSSNDAIGRVPNGNVNRKYGKNARNILPDKPSVMASSGNPSKVRSSTLYTSGNQNSDAFENSGTTTPMESKGSVKRKAPLPPGVGTPAQSPGTHDLLPPSQGTPPQTPGTRDKHYRSQVSEVLNELNTVLDNAAPLTPKHLTSVSE